MTKMLKTHHFTANSGDSGLRLDKFLVKYMLDFSRSRLQGLISQGCVTSGKTALTDAAAKIKAGQRIEVAVPETAPSHIVAQDIPLDIIYEDEHILILNKPAGLTVHPAPGHPDLTLVNALLAHCGDSLSGIGGVARPGIVHRIDKETSGLLAVAKNDAAHASLSEQLATRTLKRTYTALIWGAPRKKTGSVSGNIGRSPANRKKMAVLKSGGKPAVTHYKILEEFSQAPISRVECQLETGRTHQIRVHFSHLGHALVGDPVYGQSTVSRLKTLRIDSEIKAALLAFSRQALHAAALELVHPASKKAMRFTCPLPEDLTNLIQVLGK